MTLQTPRRTSLALGVLAAATFIGVSTELLPVALLPAISADLGTSEAAAGIAVSGYALVVAATCTPLTAATASWPRRRLLVVVLAAYAASTAAAAAAPGLAVLLVARGIGGACHGVFWAMVVGYAARLVPPGQVGRATAAVFTGSALAVAVGLPLSTAVGQALGWRTAFLGAAAVAAAVAVLARVLLPALPAIAAPATTGGRRAGSVRAALARPGVRSVVAVTALVVLGHYTFFSYISIYLRDVGVPGAGTSAALLVYGVAGVAGTVALGRAYDRWPGPSFASLTTALLLALATLAVLPFLGAVGPGGLAPWIAPATLGAVAVLGAAAIALPVPLQAMILKHAGPAPDAASSLFVSAFNLGIGGGGAVGALVLSTTDAPFLPVVALVVAAAGVATAARTAPTRTHAQQEVNA